LRDAEFNYRLPRLTLRSGAFGKIRQDKPRRPNEPIVPSPHY